MLQKQPSSTSKMLPNYKIFSVADAEKLIHARLDFSLNKLQIVQKAGVRDLMEPDSQN